MANETNITIIGNIVNDPELRFTNNNVAVASFRVASTPRRFNTQTNQWEDQEALFLTVNVWREYAENVVNSLAKGMRVIVEGHLKQRGYQDKDGNNRVSYEIEANEIGPSLRYATAQVSKNPTNGQGGGQGGNFGGQQQGGFNNQQQGGFGGQQQQGGFGQ